MPGFRLRSESTGIKWVWDCPIRVGPVQNHSERFAARARTWAGSGSVSRLEAELGAAACRAAARHTFFPAAGRVADPQLRCGGPCTSADAPPSWGCGARAISARP